MSIATTQANLVALIEASALIAGDSIPVIDESRMGVEPAVKTALGTIGVCVVVYDPTDGKIAKSNLPVRIFDAAWPIEVIEAPQFNRGVGGTGKTAWDVMAAVVAAVHCQPNGVLNANVDRGKFLIDEDSFERVPVAGLNVYQVFVTTGVGL